MVDEKLLLERPKTFSKKEESKKDPVQIAKRIEPPKSDPRPQYIPPKKVKARPIEKPPTPINDFKVNGSKQRIVSNVNHSNVKEKKPTPSAIKRPSVPSKPKPNASEVLAKERAKVTREEEMEKRKKKLDEERSKMREDIKKRKMEGKPKSNFNIEWYPGWGQGENPNPSVYRQSPRNLSRKNSRSYLHEEEKSSRLSRQSSRSKLQENNTPKKISSRNASFERQYSSEKKNPSIPSLKKNSSKERMERMERIRKSEERILSRSNSARKSRERIDPAEKLKAIPRQNSQDRMKSKEVTPQSKWLLKNNQQQDIVIKQSNESLPPMPNVKRVESKSSGLKNISNVEISLTNQSSKNSINSNGMYEDKKAQVEIVEEKNIELSKMFSELQNLVNDACQKADNLSLQTHQSEDSKAQSQDIDDFMEKEELDISMEDLVSDPLYQKVETMKKEFFKTDDEALMYISGDSKLEVKVSLIT